MKGAKAALGTAFDSATREAQKLGINSPGDALAKARDKAADLQKQLSEIKKLPVDGEFFYLLQFSQQFGVQAGVGGHD